MGVVRPKSLKQPYGTEYNKKSPYECEGCACLECDFIGDCHCILKNPKHSITKTGVVGCDNFTEVLQ